MALRPPRPSQRARTYVSKMAVAQMTSTVEIVRPGKPTFDANTGKMTAHTDSTLGTTPARIYQVSGGGPMVVGDELMPIRQTMISIPQTFTPVPRVDDIVHVTDTSDDPALVDRRFRVLDVSLGGVLSPTRTLTAQNVEPNPWGQQ